MSKLVKGLGKYALAVLAVVSLVAFATASDHAHGKAVEVEGKIACAKCTLKMADAKGCQDVLVAKNDKGEATNYYMVKNEVFEKFGHTCTGEKGAKVAGTVETKDGKNWLTASKIEPKG